jgi:hypothetical protein
MRSLFELDLAACMVFGSVYIGVYSVALFCSRGTLQTVKSIQATGDETHRVY